MNQFHYGEHALYCEGVALADIAARVPARRATCIRPRRSWRTSAPTTQTFGALPHTICYAVKANGNLAMLRLLAEAGAGFDIVSGGELFRVLQGRRRSRQGGVFRRRQDRGGDRRRAGCGHLHFQLRVRAGAGAGRRSGAPPRREGARGLARESGRRGRHAPLYFHREPGAQIRHRYRARPRRSTSAPASTRTCCSKA